MSASISARQGAICAGCRLDDHGGRIVGEFQMIVKPDRAMGITRGIHSGVRLAAMIPANAGDGQGIAPFPARRCG